MTSPSEQVPSKERDIHGLCNRLAEVFNTDDTPDELSTEAREAIEELWQERDALRAEVQNGKLAFASLQALYNEQRASSEPEARRAHAAIAESIREIAENIRPHGFEASAGLLDRYVGIIEASSQPPGACTCLSVINTLIKPGDLQGNGCDETAQRNGVILAFNAVAEHQRSALTKAGE